MGTPTKQIYKFRGLNLRTNELTKTDGYATAVDNVELTKEGYLTKRRGYKEHSGEAGFIQFIDYIGLDPTDSLPNPADFVWRLIGVKADGLYGFNEGGGTLDGTWVKIVWGSAGTEPTFSEPTSWDEYEGVIYMTDPSGTNDLMKFDGVRYYRASMPKPDATAVFNAGVVETVYIKTIYEYTDWQGNLVLGEDLDLGPFSNPFTITYNNVTYDNGLFPEAHPQLTRSPTLARVAVSTHPTFGFRLVSPTAFIGGGGTINLIINAAAINNALAGDDLLSDIYDFTVRKGLPPKSKYLTVYNGLLVLGNFTEDSTLGFTRITVNTVNWSDLTTGGSVEVFPALNQQKIGKSTERITGLFGGSDNLVIFKDRNVFFLSGDIVSANYRIRDSLSEGIGCVAHQSIIKVEGGVMFLSEKGIYAARGGNTPTELSDIIEPLFTKFLPAGIQLSKAVAVLDRLNEKILLFIPSSTPSESIVVQYDYYFKEWFLYTGIDASGGFVIDRDVLKHSDGTKVFERHEAKNDVGVAISAAYSTTWMNLVGPSVKKKFTGFLAFSIDQSTWELSIAVQKNWKDVDINTTAIQFPSSSGSEDTSLPADQVNSMRFKLSNNVLDENILSNGYEYEYAYTQTRLKGDD